MTAPDDGANSPKDVSENRPNIDDRGRDSPTGEVELHFDQLLVNGNATLYVSAGVPGNRTDKPILRVLAPWGDYDIELETSAARQLAAELVAAAEEIEDA